MARGGGFCYVRPVQPFRLLLMIAMLTAASAPMTSGRGMEDVVVTANAVPLDPRDPAQDRVGRLRYLGGLHLSSADPRFGGLSGLRWIGNGLLAVTDGGNWVAFDLVETGDRLSALQAARMGLIRGPQRAPLKGKAHVDAEALEADANGLTVAFERDHRIWNYRNLGDAPWSEPFPDEAWLKALPGNSGVEAIARWGRDWQLYVAEAKQTDAPADAVLAALHGMARTYGHVAIPVTRGFRPTDAQALDAGHVLLLSRRQTASGESSAVVQVFPIDAARLMIGAAADVAQLSAPLTVDNMEGLAIRRENGRTFIYLISDDNFSPAQRTLLLKFELLS